MAQTKYSPGPVYLLDATGENCVRPGEIVDGPNACGWCGYEPAICPACGCLSHDCRSCGKQLFAKQHIHEGPNDPRILIEQTERLSDLLQIDTAKWRGEDFVNLYGSCIVTRRVIDWLRKHGAGPWIGYPVKCELAHVTDDQIPDLLRAAGSRKAALQQALAMRGQSH